MDLGDDWIAHGVTRERDTKVVRGAHQHVLKLGAHLVIDAIQTKVKVLELRAPQQEPVSRLVAVSVAAHLRF